jgi:predicted MPP superfamily phosphohydrolase
MDNLKARFLAMGPFMGILYGIFIYFLITTISNLFGGLNQITIIFLSLLIVLINISSMGVEVLKSNPITRFFLSISEVVKWMVLMYGILTLIIYIGIFINIPKDSTILFIIYLTIVPILTIYAYINAHRIVVKEHDLEINNLTENVTIAHISDLHIGSIRNKRLLKNLVSKINNIKADLVVISGDLADGSCAIDENSFLPLKKSKIPIVFTPGNHDYYPGLDNVIKAAKNANLIVLSDAKMEFKGLNIYGLSLSADNSTNLRLNNENLDFNIDKNEVNILIFHLPVSWDYFKSIGFNLQLSGHTHGGQFYPFNFLVKLPFPYLRGIFKEDNNYLSVTDGVGTLTPPMRLGTNAEIVILNLKNKLWTN